MVGVDPDIAFLYQVLDFIGVFLFAILGGTIARRLEFDVVGFIFIALFSSLGGGMLRDALIGNGPVAALTNPQYLVLALVGALIAWMTKVEGKKWDLFVIHADAIGLGVWAVTGAVKALNNDLPWASAVFLGVITAVGGGVIRDAVISERPRIFGGGYLYTIPAILAAIAMVVFYESGQTAIGMIAAPFAATTLVLLSYWRSWSIEADPNWAPVNRAAVQVKEAVKHSHIVEKRK